MGDVSGFAAAALVLGAGILWLRRVRQVRVPRNRAGYLTAMGLGALLGIAAFSAGTGLAGGIAAGFAIAGGGMFVGLRLQSTQRPATPAVEVGGPILDFGAPDDNGEPFELSSLRGKPFLLKFFRGHW